MVLAVPAAEFDAALRALHSVPETRAARHIGEVRAESIAPVIVRRALGPDQPLDEPLGAPLPRIC